MSVGAQGNGGLSIGFDYARGRHAPPGRVSGGVGRTLHDELKVMIQQPLQCWVRWTGRSAGLRRLGAPRGSSRTYTEDMERLWLKQFHAQEPRFREASW
jgi:hypothetical protein